MLRQVFADPSQVRFSRGFINMFTKITKHCISGLMFSRVFINIFLPDMRFSVDFRGFVLLEFTGFPLGSLWEHFGDIWVSIGDHLGVYWIPEGTLWIPSGTLLDRVGITLAVLGPPWVLFW